MNYFVGIDLGTQSVKVTFYNPKSESIFGRGLEYPKTPGRSPEGYLDRNIELYWRSTIDLIKSIIREEDINPKEIRALSFSVLGETFVPTDENFIPLRNAFSGHDIKGSEEAEIIIKNFGSDILHSISGQPNVEVVWPAVKILLLKIREPEIFKKTKRYLNLEDYFIYKLTGKFVSEKSMLCTSLYYDIINQSWYKPMLDFLNIEEEFLPEIKDSCKIVGNITKKASIETSLSQETLVITGAMDQIAGGVGAGNIEQGVLSETTGTSLAIGATFKGDIKKIDKNIPVYPHIMKDSYFLMPWSLSGGIFLRWFKDTFFLVEKNIAENINLDIYNIMDKLAEKVPVGSDGLIALPFLLGSAYPNFNNDAKAAFFGISFSHEKPHFVRAILESITFLIRDNIDFIKNSGISFNKIISLGGGSKSSLWCQMKADICKIPVEVPKYGSLSSSIGACFFAALGYGYFKSLKEIMTNKLLETEKIFEPQDKNSKIYDDIFIKYKNLYRNVFKQDYKQFKNYLLRVN